MVLIITPLLLRDRCLSFCFGQSWASQPRMSSSKRLSRCYGEVRYSTEHYWFQRRFQSWLQSFVALLRVVTDGPCRLFCPTTSSSIRTGLTAASVTSALGFWISSRAWICCDSQLSGTAWLDLRYPKARRPIDPKSDRFREI